MDFSDKTNIVYWYLFLFAFFLLARKSNLVPTLYKDLIEKKILIRKDIVDYEDHLIVTFRLTKTIQKGERILQIPLLEIKYNILCPVNAYRNMLKIIPTCSSDSPLFILLDGKIITYNMYQAKLRYFIRNIGLDESKFSSHSFRRGFSTLLFKAKIPADRIQLMGDWSFDAYKKYLYFSLDDKVKVAKIMRNYIRHSSVKFFSCILISPFSNHGTIHLEMSSKLQTVEMCYIVLRDTNKDDRVVVELCLYCVFSNALNVHINTEFLFFF